MADLSKFSLVFRIIIIAIVYIIIFLALRVMYKDIKSGNKKSSVRRKRKFGLEVIQNGKNTNLKKGSVIVLHRELTIGRKEDNSLILNDPYVSSHHAKVYLKNNDYILEDLESTNGTLLNSEKVSGKVYIRKDDEIKIGDVIFKVIG